MTSKHEYTCVNCPLSCSLELTEEGGEVLKVEGQGCRIGERYAREEFTDPRRVVTTTVPVRDGTLPLLPVRSAGTIPKRLVMEAAARISGLTVTAPVRDGDVIAGDILGTGVDVIASRDLERAG